MFMSSLLIISILMTLTPTPLHMSLFITSISIILSMMVYLQASSILLPSVVIISFSSGMMILFSYCSMMSTHEEKPLKKVTKSMIILPLLLMTLFKELPPSKSNSTEKILWEVSFSNILMFLMIVVIMTMVAINISFFDPTKKFTQSY